MLKLAVLGLIAFTSAWGIEVEIKAISSNQKIISTFGQVDQNFQNSKKAFAYVKDEAGKLQKVAELKLEQQDQSMTTWRVLSKKATDSLQAGTRLELYLAEKAMKGLVLPRVTQKVSVGKKVIKRKKIEDPVWAIPMEDYEVINKPGGEVEVVVSDQQEWRRNESLPVGDLLDDLKRNPNARDKELLTTFDVNEKFENILDDFTQDPEAIEIKKRAVARPKKFEQKEKLSKRINSLRAQKLAQQYRVESNKRSQYIKRRVKLTGQEERVFSETNKEMYSFLNHVVNYQAEVYLGLQLNALDQAGSGHAESGGSGRSVLLGGEYYFNKFSLLFSYDSSTSYYDLGFEERLDVKAISRVLGPGIAWYPFGQAQAESGTIHFDVSYMFGNVDIENGTELEDSLNYDMTKLKIQLGYKKRFKPAGLDHRIRGNWNLYIQPEFVNMSTEQEVFEDLASDASFMDVNYGVTFGIIF
jgi:hypothetical protein